LYIRNIIPEGVAPGPPRVRALSGRGDEVDELSP
jgi:hypothetical protein